MKLSDARQLDWDRARIGAERIIKVCDGAGFTAPECLDVYRAKIVEVAEAMNDIAAALLISGLAKESP